MIYVIRTGHEDGGYIKIGYSKSSVENRIKTLQTGSPMPLTLLTVKEGEISDEKALHATLARFRVRHNGEWFHDCEEIRSILGIVNEEEEILNSLFDKDNRAKKAAKRAINDIFADRDWPNFPLCISVASLSRARGVDPLDVLEFSKSDCSNFFIQRTKSALLLSVYGKIIHNELDGEGEIDFAIPKKTFDLIAFQNRIAKEFFVSTYLPS